MYDKVLNVPLVFCGITIHLYCRPFCINIADCVFVTLIQELCHRQFSGNFSKFSRIVPFKTLGDCFRFLEKLMLSAFLFQFPFKKYVYVMRFGPVVWHPLMKDYRMLLK